MQNVHCDPNSSRPSQCQVPVDSFLRLEVPPQPEQDLHQMSAQETDSQSEQPYTVILAAGVARIQFTGHLPKAAQPNPVSCWKWWPHLSHSSWDLLGRRAQQVS
ncbi:uncharacterized protein RHO17_001891 isoform 1-T2 [Thomomys bottae]